VCEIGSNGSTRRAFLGGLTAALAAEAMATPARAAVGDVRQLWLIDNHTGNELRAYLTIDGKHLWPGTKQYPGYNDICYLLRDTHADVEAAMSVMVLEAAYEMQQVYMSWGYNHPIVVTSAFRTIETNSAVGGALDSYHEKAGALDLVVPETPLEVVWAAAGSRVYTGGMGWYPNSHIHIDDGPRRYWRG
jgi:uncharacterized protein YcbK (DUF882 family)